jgi:hypothetical protein
MNKIIQDKAVKQTIEISYLLLAPVSIRRGFLRRSDDEITCSVARAPRVNVFTLYSNFAMKINGFETYGGSRFSEERIVRRTAGSSL